MTGNISKVTGLDCAWFYIPANKAIEWCSRLYWVFVNTLLSANVVQESHQQTANDSIMLLTSSYRQ